MRAILVAAAVAGCAPAVAPGGDTIAAASHRAIEVFDRGTAPDFDSLIAPAFVRFEGGKARDRAAQLDAMRKRQPGAPHVAVRTWSDEHVTVAGDDAVFVGRAAERGAGDRGSYIYDGYYTLSWHRSAGRWQIVVWTWQRAGDAPERDFWDDVFHNDVGFEHAPNQLLVDTVAGVSPGAALDVAMGQGRNALYLASKGWTVTGVDWSSEGIAQAQAAAKRRGLTLTTVNTDVGKLDFGVAKWDLVTMIYAGDDAAWLAKIKAAIKPGGLFVVEYFHEEAADHTPHGGFAAGQLRALFGDSFDILLDDVVDGVPDWAQDHASLVRFVARKR